MERSRWVRRAVWAAVLAACPGCLITHHSTKVIRRDEARRPVRFESDAALQAFNARAAEQKAAETNQARVLAIPFLLWWSRLDAKSDSAHFNDETSACDADGDGLITEAEALAYNPKFLAEAVHTASSGPGAGQSGPGLQAASFQQAPAAPLPEHAVR